MTLEAILQQWPGVAVAFSGGVDSTFLLARAVDVLGAERVIAITALSPTLSGHERQQCQQLAQGIGVRHVLRHSGEMDNPLFTNNGPDRCYHCKDGLFTLCRAIMREYQCDSWQLVYGANQDDLLDHRPGMEAARRHGVRAPLLESGLGKADIRRLSQQMGLPTAEKPALACLSSRFPSFTLITQQRLHQVEQAETLLRHEGFRVYRVRYHGTRARIEVGADELWRLSDASLCSRLTDGIRAAGFAEVEFDPSGYRDPVTKNGNLRGA
ncbi:MAG: ATP-dependent sacrificial sulfur transferase LarE [Magnetococcales bacterium]|nr:ATP-dependent sacrificial sulfur transferase LarE [Magnetococcales bacterium]